MQGKDCVLSATLFKHWPTAASSLCAPECYADVRAQYTWDQCVDLHAGLSLCWLWGRQYALLRKLCAFALSSGSQLCLPVLIQVICAFASLTTVSPAPWQVSLPGPVSCVLLLGWRSVISLSPRAALSWISTHTLKSLNTFWMQMTLESMAPAQPSPLSLKSRIPTDVVFLLPHRHFLFCFKNVLFRMTFPQRTGKSQTRGFNVYRTLQFPFVTLTNADLSL